VRHRGEGGMDVSERGTGYRRTRRSPTGRRGVELAGRWRERRWEGEVGALVGGGAA
jgi:hypothetical protein